MPHCHTHLYRCNILSLVSRYDVCMMLLCCHRHRPPRNSIDYNFISDSMELVGPDVTTLAHRHTYIFARRDVSCMRHEAWGMSYCRVAPKCTTSNNGAMLTNALALRFASTINHIWCGVSGRSGFCNFCCQRNVVFHRNIIWSTLPFDD